LDYSLRFPKGGNELDYSLRFPKGGNENKNEVMGMGGNEYTKVIPAHLYCWCVWSLCRLSWLDSTTIHNTAQNSS